MFASSSEKGLSSQMGKVWKRSEEDLLNACELIIKTRREESFRRFRFSFSDPAKRRWASPCGAERNRRNTHRLYA